MSMFQNLKSYYRQEASIQLNIFQKNVSPGDEVEGTITITGGATDLIVDGIFVDLVIDAPSQATKIGDYKIHNGYVLFKESSETIPFTLTLPMDMPESNPDQLIVLQSYMAIPLVRNPFDKVYLHVKQKTE